MLDKYISSASCVASDSFELREKLGKLEAKRVTQINLSWSNLLEAAMSCILWRPNGTQILSIVPSRLDLDRFFGGERT